MLRVLPTVPLLLLAACSNRLDISAIEADIKADIERQGRRLAIAEVRCPQEIQRQSGSYFRCVGELEPEGSFPIHVTQQGEGAVDWEILNSTTLLNLASVEESIQQELAQMTSRRAYVDCGSELYRPNQSGDRFECAVVGGITLGSSQIDSVLVRVTPEGNLEWQEQRQSEGAPAPAGAAGQSTAPPSASPATAVPAATSQASPPKTATGPTGRPISRPYVPGDDD